MRTKLKAAAGPTQPAKKHEVPAGPPQSWDLDAKAAWHEIPEPVRLAVQREQAEAMNGIETKIAPHLREHAEIKQVLAPARERFQAHGIRSDAEAVHRLVQWEAAIAHPQTRVQAVAELMMHNGVTVHDLFALAGVDPRQYQQQHYQQQYDPVAHQGMQEAHQQLTRFSEGKPHFEKVRYRMGELIRDHGERYMSQGGTDLAKAYNDACREAGLSDNRARRVANVSPSSRSPAVRHDTSQHSDGGTIRNAIIDAFRENRAG